MIKNKSEETNKNTDREELANRLYDAFFKAETGYKDRNKAWIRTEYRDAEGGSSAYGPVQITRDLMKLYKSNKSHLFNKDELEYMDRFIEQGDAFLKVGNNNPNEVGKTYNPSLDYGGAGQLTSLEDKDMYREVAKKMLLEHYDIAGGDFDKTVKNWRYGQKEDKSREDDKDYWERAEKAWNASESNGIPETSEAVAPHLEHTQEDFNRNINNVLGSAANYHNIEIDPQKWLPNEGLVEEELEEGVLVDKGPSTLGDEGALSSEEPWVSLEGEEVVEENAPLQPTEPLQNDINFMSSFEEQPQQELDGSYRTFIDAFSDTYESPIGYKDKLMAWDQDKAFGKAYELAAAYGDDYFIDDVASDYMTRGYSPTALEIKGKIAARKQASVLDASYANVGAGMSPEFVAEDARAALEEPINIEDTIKDNVVTSIAVGKHQRKRDSNDPFGMSQYSDMFNVDEIARDREKELALQQELAQRYAQLHNEINPFTPSERGWTSVITDVLGLVVPFAETVDMNQIISDLKDKGHKIDSPIYTRLFLGTMKDQVREYWQSLSAAEQARSFEEFSEIVMDRAGSLGENKLISSSIIGEAITDPSNRAYNGMNLLDDAFSVLDLVALGGIFKGGVKLLKNSDDLTRVVSDEARHSMKSRMDPDGAAEDAAKVIFGEADEAAEVAARIEANGSEVVAEHLMSKFGEVQSIGRVSADKILEARDKAVDFLRDSGNKLRLHFTDAEKSKIAEIFVSSMRSLGGFTLNEGSSTITRTDKGLKYTGVYGKDSGIGWKADEIEGAVRTMKSNLDDKTAKVTVYRRNYDGSTTKVDEKALAAERAKETARVKALEEAEKKIHPIVQAASASRVEAMSDFVEGVASRTSFKPKRFGEEAPIPMDSKSLRLVTARAEFQEFMATAMKHGHTPEEAADLAIDAFNRAVKREKPIGAKPKEDDYDYYLGVDTVSEYRTAGGGAFLENKVADILASGSRATYLWDISAGLARYLSDSFYNAFDKSRKTEDVINSFLEPFVKSSNKAKKITLNILEQGSKEERLLEDGSKVIGKNYTIDEILGMLPPGTSPKIQQEVVDGYHAVRLVGDIAYSVANKRVRDKLIGEGKKALKVGDSSYAASKVSDDSAINNVRAYYDPLEGSFHSADVSPDRIKQLLEEGYSFFKSNELHGIRGHKTNYIIVKNGAHTVEELPINTLNYREGYIPRLYEENYFITVVDNAMKINGKTLRPEERIVRAIGTARSKDEALELIAKMQAKATEDGAPLTFDFKHARELTNSKNNDALAATQTELEMFTKGMFYSKRNSHLEDLAAGTVSRVKDPVTSISRMTANIARQMEVAPVIELHKARWLEAFGHLTRNGVFPANAKQITQTGKLTTEEIGKAKAYWEYINLQEINSTSDLWKTSMFMFGEFLADKGWKTTGSFFRDHVKNHDPLSIIRGATFVTMLVANPFRQMFVQSSQILFLAGIDPKGIMSGKVQTLAMGLLRKEAGSPYASGKAIVGESDWKAMKRGFQRSGLSEAVDSHLFNRDALSRSNVEATDSLLQTAAQRVENTTKGVIGYVKDMGFDKGEAWNIASTYIVSFRRWRKNNPNAVFDEAAEYAVHNDARQLSLGMTQAGAYGYQKGLLSLAFQFLSIQQKALSTMLRGVPLTGGKYGNQAVTVAEARRIAVGQVLLYGASGIGIQSFVDSALDHFELDVGPDVRNILVGGVYDQIATAALMATSKEDFGHTFDFSSHIAAGSGWKDTFLDKFRMLNDNSMLDFAAGPSSTLFSRLGNALRVSRELAMAKFTGDPYVEYDSAKVALDAWLSLASGYNNVVKGWAMAQSGTYVDKHLKPLALDATRKEAVIRAVFGISTHEEANLYEVYMDQAAKRKALGKLADHVVNDISRLTGLDGNYSDIRGIEQLVSAIRHRTETLTMLYGEDDARHIMREALDRIRRSNVHGGSRAFEEYIWRIAEDGTYTIDGNIGTRLYNRGLVDEETSQQLNRWGNEIMMTPEN